MLYFRKAGGSRISIIVIISSYHHKYKEHLPTCTIFLKSWWFKDINYNHLIIISSQIKKVHCISLHIFSFLFISHAIICIFLHVFRQHCSHIIYYYHYYHYGKGTIHGLRLQDSKTPTTPGLPRLWDSQDSETPGLY